MHAELLAAARLPRSAFRANAGTEVVTDVMILRKRVQSLRDQMPDWIEVGDIKLSDDDGDEHEIKINNLYVTRPELMLGRPSVGRGMYESEEFLLKDNGCDLAKSLANALIAQLPSNGYRTFSTPIQNEVSEVSSDRVEFLATSYLDRVSERDRVCADQLLEIYAAAKEVIRLQLHDASDEELAEKQQELSLIYDRFTTRYGYIDKNIKKLNPHSPVVPFLRVLEIQTGKNSYKLRPAQSKVLALVDNIVNIYHETRAESGVQAVFLRLINAQIEKS